MNKIEATSSIIIALINNRFISTPEEISEAYKIIANTIENPND